MYSRNNTADNIKFNEELAEIVNEISNAVVEKVSEVQKYVWKRTQTALMFLGRTNLSTAYPARSGLAVPTGVSTRILDSTGQFSDKYMFFFGTIDSKFIIV